MRMRVYDVDAIHVYDIFYVHLGMLCEAFNISRNFENSLLNGYTNGIVVLV